MQQWQAQGLGIVWITLLLDDPNEGPPTQTGVDYWIETFGIQSAHIAADPFFQMVPGQSVGTPQFSIIDPRDMKVISLQEGGGTQSILTNLAQQNM